MPIEAAFAPVETGVKVTVSVQLAPAASDAPQVLDIEKSSAWPPPKVMELIASAAVPVLVTLTDFDADVVFTASLPKARDDALNLMAGADEAVTPVPLKLTVCGDPPALSEILTDAVFAPTDIGMNVIESVQLAPAGREDPQVVDKEKSSACPPANVIELINNGPAPVLVRVTDFGPDILLAAWLPKAIDSALNLTPGVGVDAPTEIVTALEVERL